MPSSFARVCCKASLIQSSAASCQRYDAIAAWMQREVSLAPESFFELFANTGIYGYLLTGRVSFPGHQRLILAVTFGMNFTSPLCEAPRQWSLEVPRFVVSKRYCPWIWVGERVTNQVFVLQGRPSAALSPEHLLTCARGGDLCVYFSPEWFFVTDHQASKHSKAMQSALSGTGPGSSISYHHVGYEDSIWRWWDHFGEPEARPKRSCDSSVWVLCSSGL